MIRGQTRPAITKKKQDITALELNATIHNRFDIEVVDANTGEVRQKAYAENIVLDSYYSYIMANTHYAFCGIKYGTGTGTLSPTRTTLFNPLGYKTMTDIALTRDTPNSVYKIQGKIVLGTTDANGSALSEVGIQASNSTTLMTHALLKDMNGNPVTITKTDTDIITIYATVFMHWASVFSSYTFNDAFLTFLIGGSALTGGYSPDGFYYTGVTGAVEGPIVETYTRDLPNKKYKISSGRLIESKGNFSGIKSIGYRRYTIGGGYVDIITIPLPNPLIYSGSRIIGEAIGTGNGSTVDFATDFPYATNAVIYVNGVEDSGAVVTSVATITNNIHFTVPPTAGAVITGDYDTSIIAKDINHVLDFSIEFTLGAYAG